MRLFLDNNINLTVLRTITEYCTMITFITAVILLVLGYIFYGKFVESIFKPMSIEPPQPTPMQMA
jgi:hypothetical protein